MRHTFHTHSNVPLHYPLANMIQLSKFRCTCEWCTIRFTSMNYIRSADQIERIWMFSVLVFNSAYNQFPPEPSRRLTAFETTSLVYQFTRICCLLKTAPLAFQRLMRVVLSGLTLSYGFVNLDFRRLGSFFHISLISPECERGVRAIEIILSKRASTFLV